MSQTLARARHLATRAAYVLFPLVMAVAVSEIPVTKVIDKATPLLH